MKFLVDMNMSPKWTIAFRSAGFDAVHWSDIGHAAEVDFTISSYAAKYGYCVVTRDLDFSVILATGGLSAPSVILHRTGLSYDRRAADELIALVARLEADLVKGAVVSVGPDRARVRSLPIGRTQ